MLKACSILLFCTLLTLPRDSQGYRPELIIREKATKKGLPIGGGLSVGEDLPVFGDSLPRRYQRAAPPAGDLPVTGPIPRGDIDNASLLGTELSKVVGLRIEEVTAPNVTLEVLSNSVVEITLKLKLHVAVKSPLDPLGEIIEAEVLKNLTIAIRREDPSLVLEDCKLPLGYMDIKVLKPSSLPLENEILSLIMHVLDRTLPQILQKTLCPVISAVMSDLDGTSLSTARFATSPPGGNSPSSVFNMSFNPDAIVLELTGRSLIEQILPLLPENTTKNATLLPVPQG